NYATRLVRCRILSDLQNISDLVPLISVVVSVREAKRIQGRSVSTSFPFYLPANTPSTSVSAPWFGCRLAHFMGEKNSIFWPTFPFERKKQMRFPRSNRPQVWAG